MSRTCGKTAGDLRAASAVAAEQRRRPRMERRRELRIHPVCEGQIGDGVEVKSLDFSTLGLGLVVEAPIAVGEQFLVPLATRSGPTVPLLYSVIYCAEAGEGRYKVGAELVSLMDLDEYASRWMTRGTIAEYICDAAGEE